MNPTKKGVLFDCHTSGVFHKTAVTLAKCDAFIYFLSSFFALKETPWSPPPKLIPSPSCRGPTTCSRLAGPSLLPEKRPRVSWPCDHRDCSSGLSKCSSSARPSLWNLPNTAPDRLLQRGPGQAHSSRVWPYKEILGREGGEDGADKASLAVHTILLRYVFWWKVTGPLTPVSFGGKSQDGVTPPSCFSPTPEKSKGNHRSGERRGWCINFSTSQPSTAEVTVWVCPSPQGEQQGCGDSSDSTPPARGPQGQPPVV